MLKICCSHVQRMYLRPNAFFCGIRFAFGCRTTELCTRNLWQTNHAAFKTFPQEMIPEQAERGVQQDSNISVTALLNKLKNNLPVTNIEVIHALKSCTNIMRDKNGECMETVEELWRTLKSSGVKLDANHYHTLLKIYLFFDHDFDPEKVLEQMKTDNIEMNYQIYQCIMMAYASRGDIKKTLDTLAIMKAENLPLTNFMYSALVLVYARNKDLAKVEEIIKIAKTDLPIQDLSHVICTVICEYVKLGYKSKVLELMDTFEFRTSKLTTGENLLLVYNFALHDEFFNEFNAILHNMPKPTNYDRTASHYVIKLLKKGKIHHAMDILKYFSRNYNPSGLKLPAGQFFIRALVDCNIDPFQIVAQCSEMAEAGLYDLALSEAMVLCLKQEKYELALRLFRAAKEKSFLIKVHYFWPLLVNCGRKHDTEGIFKLLSTIRKEFDLNVDTETIRDYVAPYVLYRNCDFDRIVLNLTLLGIPQTISVPSLIHELLMRQRIEDVAYAADKYPNIYPIFIFGKPIARCFVFTRDMNSLITILKAVYLGAVFRSAKQDRFQEVRPYDFDSSLGPIIIQIVTELIKNDNDIPTIETLLRLLVENKLPIANHHIGKIRHILDSKLNYKIAEHLQELESSVISHSDILDTRNKKIHVTSLDMATVEELCNSMEEKGENTVDIKKKLFVLYGRNNCIDNLMKLKEELENMGELSEGMYAYVINCLADSGNWQLAYKTCNEQYLNNQMFSLDSVKLLNLAFHLVENSEYESALELLTRRTVSCNRGSNVGVQCSKLIYKILNHFAEKGDIDNITKAFKILSERKFVPINNKIVGPLILVHLKRNDPESALNTFEELLRNYKFTSCLYKIIKYFLVHDEELKLNRLIELCCEVQDEMNILSDLIIIHLELDKLDDAKRLFKRFCSKINATAKQRFFVAYKNMCAQNCVHDLCNLIEITKNTTLLDRYELYSNAILACAKTDDVETAKYLKIEMEEENISSIPLLTQLAKIFMKHDIPFDVPSNNTNLLDSHHPSNADISSSNLKKLLDSGKLDEAIEVAGKSMNSNHYSLLMKACLNAKRYDAAKELCLKFHKNAGGFLSVTDTKQLLAEAAKNADSSLIEFLGNLLPNKKKHQTSFYNAQANCYFNAKESWKYIESLNKLLAEIESDEKLVEFVKTIPSATLITMMQESARDAKQIKQFLEECINKGDHTAAPNILWTYYMLTEQFSESDNVWRKYIDNMDGIISLKTIAGAVSEKANIALGEKLIQCLENKQINSAALGIGYGVLINAYVKNNRVPEAMELLDRGVQKIPISKIIVSSLYTLQAACAVKQIAFPYQLKQKQEAENAETLTKSTEKLKHELKNVYNIF